MKSTCEYCRCAGAEGATKCANCGAPFGSAHAPDYRFCPHCKRRLLALGSPACNYCGRSLPENYVRRRDEMRRRIDEANRSESGDGGVEVLDEDGDDNLRRALKALFDLDSSSGRKKKK